MVIHTNIQKLQNYINLAFILKGIACNSICTVIQLLRSSTLACLHVHLQMTPWGCNCLRIESGYSGKIDHIIFLQNSKLDIFNLVVMLSSPPSSVGGRRQFVRPRRWRRADTSHQKVIMKWLQLIPFNPRFYSPHVSDANFSIC